MLNRATNRKAFAFFSGFLLILLIAGIAFANQPSVIGVSGRLTNADGTVLTGAYNFTFNIFNAQTGGTALWTEIHDGRAAAPKVGAKNGVWSTVLGNNTSLSLPWNQTYYLELIVDGETLAPRGTFTSVPFTLNATNPGKYNFTGRVNVTGGLEVSNSSTEAFKVTNNAGTNFLVVDSTNSRVNVLRDGFLNTSGAQFTGAVNFTTTVHMLSNAVLNTSITANNLTGGTIGNARFDATVVTANASQIFSGVNSFNGTSSFNGTVFFNTTSFIHVLGNAPVNMSITANNLTGGTIGNARFDATVVTANASQIFSGVNSFNGTSSFNSTVYFNATSVVTFDTTTAVHVLRNTAFNVSLTGNNITGGTIGIARFPTESAFTNASQIFSGVNSFNGTSSFNGTVFFNTTSFIHVLGNAPVNMSITANNLTGGTIGGGRLPAEVVFSNASNTFSTTNTFNGTTILNSTVHYLRATSAFNITLDITNLTNLTTPATISDTLLGLYNNTSSTKLGGLKIQHGNVTWVAANSNGVNVTLTSAYASANSYAVIVTPEVPNGPAGDSGLSTTVFSVVYYNGTVFNITNISAGALSPRANLRWVAIGV